MPHLIEAASTGRSKCRGCGGKITAGELRFGESLPNPFADGETTHWFHLECGAMKRPAPFLEALPAAQALPERERLEAEARRGVEHERLSRIDGAERAPTGRAQCRHCREPIGKDSWRIRLVFYEDGRFQPAGYVHPGCAAAYFGTADVLARVRRFAPDLGEEDVAALQAELQPAGG
ncbi:MAG TPA: hypothetical protein VEQ10_00805 [Vicinamibacteria bacterium]|nr:hypothetical protein [Vicinamibacteria bacterium]